MTDVTPELLARLRDLAAKWPTTIVVEGDVVAALVAEVERLTSRIARLEASTRHVEAPLSAEQGASGQGDRPDEFEAWIGRAMMAEEQGWGA